MKAFFIFKCYTFILVANLLNFTTTGNKYEENDFASTNALDHWLKYQETQRVKQFVPEALS